MEVVKEDSRKMKDSLMDSFQKEINEQIIGGSVFLNMKTLMNKKDGIGSTLVKKLEKHLFSEHEFMSTSVEDGICAEPTAVASQTTTVLFCHNKNTAFNLNFNIGCTNCKLLKGNIFLSTPLYSLIISGICGDLSKQISWFMLISHEDCENGQWKLWKMEYGNLIIIKWAIWRDATCCLGRLKCCNATLEWLAFSIIRRVHTWQSWQWQKAKKEFQLKFRGRIPWAWVSSS